MKYKETQVQLPSSQQATAWLVVTLTQHSSGKADRLLDRSTQTTSSEASLAGGPSHKYTWQARSRTAPRLP